MTTWPSVDQMRAELAEVLGRFRSGRTRAFSFGDGIPEVVVLTYDEFEDLGGESKFAVPDQVAGVAEVARRLQDFVESARSGTGAPVVWGAEGEPEAVLLSTAQYRDLRGDDHPPAGVIDDPTVRVYDTEPLPDSRPLDLDELAADDPLTRELLDEIRAEKRSGRDDR
ncbi:hypothetical protein [Kribbella sp.]|uniref:hypothetical protein n=1 Tax=Kribbella sp. TaxID=1871183 RepID=UPI002D2B098B|nr:hypothetical protein [Kribbella sp.]HZX07155.1 hypothetical protein [Kribbella sp.]